MSKRVISMFVAACAVIVLGVPASALAHWGLPVSFGAGHLQTPVGVSVTSAGDVFVADLFEGESSGGVFEFDPAHNVLIPPSPFGAGSGEDSGVAVDPATGDVYVMDAQEQAVGNDRRVEFVRLAATLVEDGSEILEGAPRSRRLV